MANVMIMKVPSCMQKLKHEAGLVNFTPTLSGEAFMLYYMCETFEATTGFHDQPCVLLAAKATQCFDHILSRRLKVLPRAEEFQNPNFQHRVFPCPYPNGAEPSVAYFLHHYILSPAPVSPLVQLDRPGDRFRNVLQLGELTGYQGLDPGRATV